jgi:hypothetical protein
LNVKSAGVVVTIGMVRITSNADMSNAGLYTYTATPPLTQDLQKRLQRNHKWKVEADLINVQTVI